MITIIKAFQHDKKKQRKFYKVMGYHNNVRFLSHITIDSKENQSIMNWIRVHNTTPEESQTAREAGLKGDQSILELLSNDDKETILSAINEEVTS